MRLVATQRAVGMRVGRDVRDGRPGSIPLLRAGATLSERYAGLLLDAGINALYVNDELSAGIVVAPALTERTRAQAETALASAFHEAPAALAGGQPLGSEAVGQLESVAKLIAAELAAVDDAVLALSDLATSDAYTLQHSIDVCVVGLLVARRLFSERGRLDASGRRSWNGIDAALVRLGLGLLLHDIGKLAVPREILQKPGPLTAPEWAFVKRHPVFGIEMLTTDHVSYHAKAAVRNHHERWDGRGYPDGLAGERVPQFARIAAVADVYDAVTSERPYKTASPPAVGWATIVAGAGTAFDPEVADAFRRTIAPYPPGVEVTLRDGRRGIVAAVPSGDVERPVVRVVAAPDGSPLEPVELPLAEHPELELTPAGAA